MSTRQSEEKINLVAPRIHARNVGGFGAEDTTLYECFTPPKYIIVDEIDRRIASVCEKQPLVEIPIEGKFNQDMAENFERLMQNAIRGGHKLVVIRVNSPGGSVYALNQMLGTLEMAKQMGIICVTMCTGIAMSCGSIMLAMGTKGHRYMSRHARVLLHEISGGMQGSQTGMENELAEYAFDNADLFRKIARNAGLETDYYLSFVKSLHKDLFIHPSRALWLKLVDHIDLPYFKRVVTIDYIPTLSCEDPTPEQLGKMIEIESKSIEPLYLDVLQSIPVPQIASQEDPYACNPRNTKTTPTVVTAKESAFLPFKVGSKLPDYL